MLAALVMMLLARVLVLLAALSLARELLVQAMLARELLAQAELLLAQTPQEFLVSLLPLEVFAACFESAVA